MMKPENLAMIGILATWEPEGTDIPPFLHHGYLQEMRLEHRGVEYSIFAHDRGD